MSRILPFFAILAIAITGAFACGGDDDADPTVTPEPTSESGTQEPTPGPSEGTGAETAQCPFQVPEGVDVECGVLNVPENHADGTGNVRLPYAILRAQATTVEEDPIIYLSGGPGESALALLEQGYGLVFEPMLTNRDIIVFDQRGTGSAEPSLACTELVDFAWEAMEQSLERDAVIAGSQAALEACHTRLTDSGIDLAAYNSAASAQDMEALRLALDYDRWNIHGISYGSRLALTAMRDYPDSIRAVVLDSAYPLEVNLYEEVPTNAARAMNALFDACAADTACSERFGDLQQTFTTLVQRLNQEPADIEITDITTGQPFELALTGDDVAGFLFQSLYQTALIPFLPEIIDGASDGEFGTIGLLQSAMLLQLDMINTGLQLSVQCHEEVTFADAQALRDAAAEHPELEGFFQTAVTLGPSVVDVCEQWDVGAADAVENEAVTSDIPTLVLAGDMDPITPPAWGEAVASNLANSFFFNLPYTGHGVVISHACAADIQQQFLDDPASEPDSACIGDIPAPAFTAEGLQVEMQPYESPTMTGLAPADWAEVVPGIFQESILVNLVQQVVPGVTAEVLLAQVVQELGIETPLEPFETVATDHAEWTIYALEEMGQSLYLGLADHEQGLFVIQIVSSPERSERYLEEVFRPALEAFAPAP